MAKKEWAEPKLEMLEVQATQSDSDCGYWEFVFNGTAWVRQYHSCTGS